MKAVVFDFYGTLAEFNAQAMSWPALVAEIGYVLPSEVLDEHWNVMDGVEHDAHSRSREHYVAWQEQRIRDMLTACEVPRSEQDTFIARVRDDRRHRNIEAYDEVAAVLDDLRHRGIAVAICSNWDWDLREAMETAGLTGEFDVTISSAWVGARKPHPRIYDHTLRELGVAADEVLFVGDTWTCDVDGPRAAGMRALYLRRAHFGADATAPADHSAHTAVHRAADLRVILDLVP